MLDGIEDRVVLDLQLRPHEPGQPAVDRRRPEVVLGRVIGNAVEVDSGVREQLEAEGADHRPVRLDIVDDRVDAPEARPHVHVQPLDVEPAGRLDRRRRLAEVARKPGSAEQDALTARHWILTKVLPAQREDRILLDESVAHPVDLAHHVETGDLIEPVPDDAERLGQESPPRPDRRSPRPAACNVRRSRRSPRHPRAWPRQRSRGGRSSGRTPPGRSGSAGCRADPRCSATCPGSMRGRPRCAAGAKPPRDTAWSGPDRTTAGAPRSPRGRCHGSTSPSSLSSTNGSLRRRSNASCGAISGSIAASSESVGRRTTEAASRISRVLGIEDAEIDLGQALDDRLDRHGLEADVRPLRQRGSGESKGQGMTACKSVDPVGSPSSIQTVLDEQRLGGVARKVLEGHAAEEDAEGARPARHRRLAPRHDDPHVVAQAGTNV